MPLSVSSSFGDMLSFTLTAFVELMDHGIVSWDTFSVAFIKKVMSVDFSGLKFFPSFLPS